MKSALVLLTDFGLKERFVASMKGVAYSIDPELKIFDLTHMIRPFHVWEASETLAGTIKYWPKETVFVAVVDPGVGTKRKSIVAKTETGHFIVTPDNGTLTSIKNNFGISEVREIDETLHRRPGSEKSHTFHGRDVYVYVGALLAANKINFSKIGRPLTDSIKLIEFPGSVITDDNNVTGFITKIEDPYGNIVTNVVLDQFEKLKLDPGKEPFLQVEISYKERVIFNQHLKYTFSFGYERHGAPLIYSDSEQQIGIALNGENFADKYEISSGPNWKVIFRKNFKKKF